MEVDDVLDEFRVNPGGEAAPAAETDDVGVDLEGAAEDLLLEAPSDVTLEEEGVFWRGLGWLCLSRPVPVACLFWASGEER